MDAITALHSRRSIRTFTNQVVSEEQVHQLLDAAMIAPSAGNAQPWRFLVVDDPALLARMPEINPYASMAPKAPLGILVCSDLQAEKYPGFWVQDCSAAIQNLLLAATALGLGSVWTGIYPLPERVSAARNLFALPEHIVPLAFLVLGHPAHPVTTPQCQSRFDATKVRRNTWNS